MTKDPWVNKVHQAMTYLGNCVYPNKKLLYRSQHRVWVLSVSFMEVVTPC